MRMIYMINGFRKNLISGLLIIFLLINTIFIGSVNADTEEYFVSINLETIYIGETTILEITVENESSDPLEDVYVGLYGCGINTNGTTDLSGIIAFSITPESTGEIHIDVGSEGNTIAQTIEVIVHEMEESFVVSIDPEYISVGYISIIDVLVTNESSNPLEDVYVGLYGCGINTNGTTDLSGIIAFSITPESTGEIHIDVGSEGNNITQFITVTNWALKVNTSPSTVFEGEKFTVDVVKQIEETPVEGALVTLGTQTLITDSQGQVNFTAPDVDIDSQLLIIASSEGYIPGTNTIEIRDKLNVDLTIDANRLNIFFGKVSATVLNIEDVTISNLNLSMEIKYGFLGRKSEESSVLKSKIASEESQTLEIKRLRGFGGINISISAYADGVDKVTQEINGFIFGRLIFLKS